MNCNKSKTSIDSDYVFRGWKICLLVFALVSLAGFQYLRACEMDWCLNCQGTGDRLSYEQVVCDSCGGCGFYESTKPCMTCFWDPILIGYCWDCYNTRYVPCDEPCGGCDGKGMWWDWIIVPCDDCTEAGWGWIPCYDWDCMDYMINFVWKRQRQSAPGHDNQYAIKPESVVIQGSVIY